MSLDNIGIGGKNRCYIIAEIGQNHQGDIDVAKSLIDAAKVRESYFSSNFQLH